MATAKNLAQQLQVSIQHLSKEAEVSSVNDLVVLRFRRSFRKRN